MLSNLVGTEDFELKETDNSFKITFQPSQKTITVPPGTLLLDAAVKAGLSIDTPCGGQGRCGRCLVKVEEGEVSRRENPHLSASQIEQGWVLSCVARAAGDLVLTVPTGKERERAVEDLAAARAAAPVQCEWPHYPLVRQFTLKLEPPTLQDSATDMDRLTRALRHEHSLEGLEVGLPLMRRLAQDLRHANWHVTATVDLRNGDGEAHLIDLSPGKARGPLLGVAVDIGTTNVVVDLVDLRTGRTLGRAAARNKQVARGEDVISRIVYTERGNGLDELQRLVIETINELVDDLAHKHKVTATQIYQMVTAGNTTMGHIFLGLHPKTIRHEPYVPTTTHYPVVTAAELGLNINPNASVYSMPAVAAYVGGDITAGVLSSCLFRTDNLTLFLDVGTNGEIVLGNAEWMMTCACSAGPAFEGAGVASGMRATDGAIEEIRINSKTLEPTVQVIGDITPQGICGSGMISALSEMMLTGVIDRSGRMKVEYVNDIMGPRSRVRRGDHGAEYVIVRARESGSGKDIVLTEVDINNLVRTKGAIYAGIAVMVHSIGIKLSDIQEVLIGGAFGQHINVEQAIHIGLLPDLPWERFKFLGNTSAWGAYNALVSKYARAEADEIARKMTYLELIADNTFMTELTAALFLPHTDLNTFPSVKALLEKESNK
ncbi:MAG: DUF4445 domain-containing protein [Chloroflexi bacterium]|nr:DUF4445 domain-containing protein [Chloroflexota bacterium]